MDCSTGHLVRDLDKVTGDYTLLPDDLQEAASEELGLNEETTVDLDGDSPLANWARAKRRQMQRGDPKRQPGKKLDVAKLHKKRQMAKASRRRNH